MDQKQKRERIRQIEADVQQIMMQLHHIEYKVDANLVRKDQIPRMPKLPKMKTPSFFKTIWIGFKQEMKQQKSPE